MSFENFIRELNGNRAEGELIKTAFYALLTSLLTVLVLYMLKLRFITEFVPKYGFYIFFSCLSYSLLLPTLRQVRAYQKLPSMSGMMIGMTSGMVSGFLTGFFIGATNGMFVGTCFGMLVGIIFGVWNGKCCGTMGMMEGIMAGFMGGLMGAMTAVMMLNDHVKIALVIIFLICAIILASLNYLIYQETRTKQRVFSESSLSTIIISFVLTVLTIGIMVFGPKSFLFG